RLYDIPDDFDETGVLDPRYVSSEHSSLAGQRAYAIGGNDLFTSSDLTETHTVLADYTNQLNRVHQVKAGFSVRQHSIDRGNFGIEIGAQTNWQPVISRSP